VTSRDTSERLRLAVIDELRRRVEALLDETYLDERHCVLAVDPCSGASDEELVAAGNGVPRGIRVVVATRTELLAKLGSVFAQEIKACLARTVPGRVWIVVAAHGGAEVFPVAIRLRHDAAMAS
jgi:hypothetical protein